VSIETALRELLEAAAEAGARRALAEAKLGTGPRLTPIKSAKIAYRLILEAEKKGELRVYRRGHASFVDDDELDAWIRRAAIVTTEVVAPIEPTDDIGELIAMNNARRRPRKAKSVAGALRNNRGRE